MSTLTITIENMPEGAVNDTWKYANKEAGKEFGIQLIPTDKIVLDFDFICKNHPDNREILSELVGAAISGHLIMEADKILNQLKK